MSEYVSGVLLQARGEKLSTTEAQVMVASAQKKFTVNSLQ